MSESSDVMKPSSLKAGTTPAELELYAAVNSNNLAMVKTILSANTGMNLNFIIESASEHNTPLLNALSYEYMDIAHYLLENRASPWVTNSYNLSGLHMLAMVGKEMTPKKEQQVLEFLKKLMTNKKVFMSELNRTAPESDPRTPLTLSLQYQPPKLMMEFSEILLKEGAKYKTRGPLWAAVLNSPNPSEKLKFLAEKFPKEFTTEKFKEGASEFNDQNAFLASAQEANFALLKFIYETDPKVWSELLNQHEGILHKIMNNISKGNLKDRAEIMIYLIEQGADPTIVNPSLKKTLETRLKELQDKTWATGEMKDFSKLMLFKIDELQKKKFSSSPRV